MRCAVGIEMLHEAVQELLFDPMVEDAPEEEHELHEEDLDIGWYEEGKIDLADVVCEAIVLDLPMVIHCDLDFVTKPNPQGCLVLEPRKENTLENLFADLLKKQ